MIIIKLEPFLVSTEDFKIHPRSCITNYNSLDIKYHKLL